jgi:hypothetical protein
LTAERRLCVKARQQEKDFKNASLAYNIQERTPVKRKDLLKVLLAPVDVNYLVRL